MIYYFSGTGNSRYVASRLASLLGDETKVITPDTEAQTDEQSLGIIFPVYAWGLPNIVERFVTRNAGIIAKSQYVYCVMTCGDDMGYADHIMKKQLNGHLNAAFSVPMPNTYVCLPGFNTDSSEVAKAKVAKTTGMLNSIARWITKKEGVTQVTRGAMPWMKSYVLRPLFNRFLVTDKYFHATDLCSRCGLCTRNCPTGNINMTGSGTRWNNHYCTGCLRCYHSCPKRAIEFGPFTKGKGQKETF